MKCRRALRPAFLALALLAAPAAASPQDGHEADRAFLLEGLEVLPRLGAPGPVAVFGDGAFAVLTGKAGGAAAPVVAAVRAGQGRAVVFGHGAYLGTKEGSLPFLERAVLWAAGAGPAEEGRRGAQSGEALPPRVALLHLGGGLASALEERGFAVEPSFDALREVPAEGEAPYRGRVVLWSGRVPADDEEIAALRAFVEGGGGLVGGTCPWGVAQVNARRGFRLRQDLPENRLLLPWGLTFGGGIVEASGAGGFPVAANRAGEAHAGRALALLTGRPPDGADLRQALSTVELALAAVPADDPFLRRVEEAAGPLTLERTPAEGRPLGSARPRDRLALKVWWRRHGEEAFPPAAPGSGDFPGAVPPQAPRESVEVEAAAGRRGWISTGRYAAPGERIRALPLDGLGEGWRLRIGCHKDVLWGKDPWKRWPQITRSVPLPPEGTETACPFGGLVYLEAPGEETPRRFRLEGTVEAPLFILGRDDARSWRRARQAPAPWAELQGRHLVITLPSASIRGLDDPAPVLAWWDRVLEAQAELAGRPAPEARPERFVADRQIVAGYMHAGYPIMTGLDVATPKKKDAPPPVLDLTALEEKGNWGFFHELGHNLQRPWWTFAGTGEVTNNLFTLYAMDRVAGIEPWGHPWLVKQQRKEAPYLEAPDFARWKADPGLALLFFARIQQAFGWEPFRRFFREAEALPPGERPKTDAAERDHWLVSLSRHTGRDLGPWFERWAIPVSAAARAAASACGPPWAGPE